MGWSMAEFNVPGQSEQIALQTHCATCVCGKPTEGKGPAWSRFHEAAMELAAHHPGTVDVGILCSAIETSLDAAYRRGVIDGSADLKRHAAISPHVVDLVRALSGQAKEPVDLPLLCDHDVDIANGKCAECEASKRSWSRFDRWWPFWLVAFLVLVGVAQYVYMRLAGR